MPVWELTSTFWDMPPFDRLVTDPLFFKRGLVVHVNLALVAWFYSFIAALLFLVPGPRPPGTLVRHSASISGAGVLMMLVAAGLLPLGSDVADGVAVGSGGRGDEQHQRRRAQHLVHRLALRPVFQRPQYANGQPGRFDGAVAVPHQYHSLTRLSLRGNCR